MLINSPDKSLKIKLAGTPSAELQWNVNYIDTIIPMSISGTTDGTNAITIVSGIPITQKPPQNTSRIIQEFSLCNTSDAVQQITISLFDGADERQIFNSVNLGIGYTLHYGGGKWYSLDEDLSIVNVIITDTEITIGQPVVGGTAGAILYTDYSGNLANSIISELADASGLRFNSTVAKHIYSNDGDTFLSLIDAGTVALNAGNGAKNSQLDLTVGAAGFNSASLNSISGEFIITDGALAGGINQVSIATAKTLIAHLTELEFDSPLYTFSQLTASTVPYIDASKHLVSSSVTPTELGYLSGVTSGIQSQFSNTQPSDATLTALAGLTITANSLIYGTGTDAFSVLAQNATATRKFLREVNSTAPVWDTIVAGDIPTLNQNTTGSAASLSISGQTGLLTFTGLTSTNIIKTVRDAADTILELGGSYTPTGNWTNMQLVTPTIASFTNATHNHQNAAGGGTLDATAIFGATILPVANGGNTGNKLLYSNMTPASVGATTAETQLMVSGLVSDIVALDVIEWFNDLVCNNNANNKTLRLYINTTNSFSTGSPVLICTHTETTASQDRLGLRIIAVLSDTTVRTTQPAATNQIVDTAGGATNSSTTITVASFADGIYFIITGQKPTSSGDTITCDRAWIKRSR
jgi:hypothetical protein